MGWSAVTRTDRLIGVGTPALCRNWLTLTVTRDEGGRVTESIGIATGVFASSDPWKVSAATVGVTLAFWRVRYSTKPGRTVPSAKLNMSDGALAPMTSWPPFT